MRDCPDQGAKKDSFTAHHSGKVVATNALAQKSFQLAPKKLTSKTDHYNSSVIWIP